MKQGKMESLRYLNPGYVSRAVRRFGYQFSPWKYAGCFVGVGAVIGTLAIAFRLKAPCILIISVVAVCFIPGMFMMTYQIRYETRRFEDISAYTEQILYSFKRRAKILNALEDVLTLFEEGESKLYDAVQRAIGYIQTGNTKGNIYKEAFSIIEKEYGCVRVYKIHDFLIEAEEVGGDFSIAAEILLKDRKQWIDRAYELQRDKNNVKVKVTIGIGLSFLIGAMTVFMMPKEFHVSDSAISQVVTTLMIILNMIIWYIAWRKLSKSMLQEDVVPDVRQVKKRYDYVMHSSPRKERRKSWLSMLLVLPLLGLFIWKRNRMGTGMTLFMGILLGLQFKRKYGISLKYVTREVEKVFPEWLMNMSLHLQTDNVHVALTKSVAQAPVILRDELSSLIKGIEVHPDSVKPYLNFMAPLTIPDVTSAMKVLYSMAEFGTTDADGQMGPLAERGIVMTDKAERLKSEDYIAGVGFLVLLPMITGVMKMLTDLALVIVYILAAVNTV